MARHRLWGPGVAVVMAALAAAGCCDKEKKQLVALTQDYNDLSSRNKELRDELAKAKADEQDLESKLSATETELGAAKDELARLKAKGPEPGDGKGTAGGWDRGLGGDKITVGSDLLFSAGRATLSAKGKTALNKIVADLKDTYAGLPVRVMGYTDGDPIKRSKNLWKDNLDLSANRAMAVTRYLISKGVSAARVETIGMGATHPIASNTTKAGKAKNRRVEIVVIRLKPGPAR